jgi:hypothetical protein
VLRLAFATGGPCPVSREGRVVQAWSTETGEVYATAYAATDRRWIEWPGLATFAFAPGSPEVTVWPAAGAVTDEIAATFFRVLQPVVLQALGWQALHASAVAIDGQVVALCGRSGSGKSTLAYALGRDWHQWSDDALVVDRGADREIVAVRLPFAPRLRPAARTHFPEWTVGAGAPHDATPLPLGAVVVLEQSARQADPVRARRVSPSEAFQLLITHAHCFDHADPADARRLIDDYLAIADAVPVHALAYRPGLDRLAQLKRAVLDLAPPRHRLESDRAICAGG